MSEPSPRLLVLVAAVVWPFVLTGPTAHRLGAEVAVAMLVGLSLVVAVGWLRLLTLFQPAALLVGAWMTAETMVRGLTLPVAALAGTAAGVVPALVALALCGRRPRQLMPITSLLVTAATAGLVSLLALRPVPRPTFVGIDLSGDRAVYFVTLLVVAGAYRFLLVLRDSDVGRGFVVSGWSPDLARRSGIRPTPLLRTGIALSGALAGLAGAMTVLVGQAVPDLGTGAVTAAVAYLFMPFVAGAWSIPAVGVAAGVFVVAPRFSGPLGLDQVGVAALGLVLALLVLPGGVAGLAGRLRASPPVRRARSQPSEQAS